MPKRYILLIILLAGLLLCMPAFAWGENSAFTPQTPNNELDNETAEEWLNKGVELYRQGKNEDAVQSWDEAIEINPQLAGAWYNKGLNLHNQGKYDEAIIAYDQALKINPQLANAWYNKGAALGDQGKYDEAIKAYDQAIKINPQFAEAWNNKGWTLKNQGKYDEAINCFNEAIRLDHEYVNAWNGKGAALNKQGEYDDRITVFEELILLNSNHTQARNNKGVALKNLGKYDEAIMAYDEAIRLDPKYVNAWNNKGVALKNLGKYDEAIKAYDEAIRLDPKNVDAWYGRGGALCALGNHDDAIKAYDEAIKINPLYANAWQHKGFVLQNIGRIAEAEANFAKAKELGYIIPRSIFVGYKNVEIPISTEVGFAGQKLVEREAGSGDIITERFEYEDDRQLSINASQSILKPEDALINNSIASWKSLIKNDSNGTVRELAPQSMSRASANPRVICNASGDQSYPVVGGNDQVGYYVAWMDNRTGNPDIYAYILAQEIELPMAGPYEDMYPEIEGNIIAWVSRDPLNVYGIEDYWSIWTFDISTGNSTDLVYGLENATPISLSADNLAYLRKNYFGWMVYTRPLYEKEVTPDFPPNGINPRAGADFVVFQSNKNDSWDIYMWKRGGSPVPLQSDGYDQINPATDGHIVVWQDNRTGNWDIYAYDPNSSKMTQITRDFADQINPDVENGVIVWQDNRSGNWDLYAYDQNEQKVKAICTDVGNQTQPRIETELIVWTDDRSGDRDIYLCENYMP